MKKILSLVFLLGFSLAAASCAPAPTQQPAACPTLECPAPQPTATPVLSQEEAGQRAIANAATLEELVALVDQFMQSGEYSLAYDAALKMTEIDPQNADGYVRASQAMLTLSVQSYDKMNEALAKGMQNVNPADREWMRQWVAQNEPNLRLHQGFIPDYSSPDQINMAGNTNSNVVNGGLVTRQGDWVYFSNTSDNGKLYKMRISGEEMTRLNDDTAADINVVGDWVYYSNLTDNRALYKVLTDGSERTRIGEEQAENIIVVGDWIYYANNAQGLAIYKIKTDGSQRTELRGGGPFIQISVEGEWIYFAEKKMGERAYFRMRSDGSEVTPIPIEGQYSVALVEVGVVYYFSIDENVIYRMLPDGSEKTALHENFMVHAINVIGDELYLSFYLDIEGNQSDFLSMVKTDRSDSGKIATESSEHIFLVGDGWIYYLNQNDNNMLYKMRIDGSDNQKIQ